MAELYRRSGSETPVNATFAGIQSAPAITALGNGNYVVVWRDDAATDARGQIFGPTGVKVGGEFLLHSAGTGIEIVPKVAALSDGGFVAVWSDTVGDGGTVATGIHGQRFDATGAPAGGEFQVNTVTVDGAQSNPNVTGLENGRFVVTWTDPASSNEIKAAIFAADGTPELAEIAVTNATPAQNNSTVTMLDDGGFVVAWYNGSGISARAYTSAGVPEGAAFTVNSTFASAQVQPSITALAGGGFVVTWTDQTVSGFPVGNEIRARVYDADGLAEGGDFVVNTRTLGNQITPSVAALASGGFVVVWDDASGQEGETNDNGSRGIKAQVFGADGTREGAEFLVNTTVAQNQVTPVVTGLAGGGFAVSWQDFGGLDGAGAGIVTQTYEPFDAPITDLLASTTTLSETPIQNNPVATLTGVGAVNAIFTYTLIGDTTGGAFEIRGNQLFVAAVKLLDFEAAPNPQVTVRVTDENGHSYDELLTLSLIDAAVERPMQASDDILVNTATAGGQIQAEIATLSNGGFIVVWTDQSVDSGDIKAQRFDADGNKVGTEFEVNTTDGAVGTTTALQTSANVAGLDDGGFIVTWTHFVASGSESAQELRGQFYNADGTARGTEFLIGQPVNGGSALSVIAVADNGDVVISWRSGTLNMPSGQGDVMARIYAPDGTEVKTTFAIANPTGNQGEQTIVATDDGGFVVAWRDDASPGTIKMRFFDSAYLPRGAGDIVVNAQTADIQTTPVIAKLSNGNFVVTWSTQVRDPSLNYNVHHRIFDANGTAITGELDSNIAPAPTIQNDSRVVALANGEFVIFWTDNSSSGPANLIGQRFGADGLRIGEPFIATQEILYAQGSSGVTSLGGDRFAYIWSDTSGIGGDNNGNALKLRIFDAVISNDLPVLADVATTLSVAEDDAPALLDADVSFSDPDNNFNGGSLVVDGLLATDVVSIRNVGAGAGEIGVSGTNVTYAGVVIGSFAGGAGGDLVVTFNAAATSAAIEALIENLTYENTSDTPVADRDLTVTVSDSLAESTSATMTVTVTPVNDAPVHTGLPATLLTGEDMPVALNGGLAIDPPPSWISDADSTTVTTTLSSSSGTFSVTGSGTAVVAGDGTGTVTISGSVADVNLAVYHASYTPAADAYGSSTITVSTTDGSGSDTDTIDVTIIPARDAPEGADVTRTATEDTNYALHALDFGFSDIDGDSLSFVILSSTPLHGRIVDLGGYTVWEDLTGDGVPDLLVTVPERELTAGDTLDPALMALGYIVYIPEANANGTAADSFTYQVVDNGGVPGSAGTVDPTPNTLTFDITAVDDAPTVDASASYSATEQVALDLKGTIHVADLDTAGEVTVTLSVGTGTLDIDTGTSGVTVTEVFADQWELVGTVAEIEALLNTDGTSSVSYTYDDDYPPPNDTLTVTIDDGFSTGSETAQITIVAVNDAPEVDLDFLADGNDAVAVWTEGDGPQLLAPDAYFDDDNDGHDGATLTVTINGATTGDQLTLDSVGTDLGELSISGNDVLYEGVIVGTWSGGANGTPLVVTFNADACYCSIELAMASVLYETTDNLAAASSRMVDFTLVDGGGTANAGSDTTTSSVELTTLPLAEVIAGPPAAGDEDAAIALTGIVIDGVAFDPAGDVITVRLGVGSGTLAISTTVAGGLDAGDVAGNGTGLLVLTGTQDAINATLAAAGGLTYRGDADFFGSDTLSIDAHGVPVDGTFGFTPMISLPLGDPVMRLDMHDIDGDGTSDLVFGVPDAVVVFGSSIVPLPLPDPGMATGFAFEDFDGDGLVDIAIAVSDPARGYLALASSVTGTVLRLADVPYAFDVSTGDFNGDARPDLVVSDPLNGRVAIVLAGAAPGTFLPVEFTAATSGLAGALAVGDFNQDSILDILVSNSARRAGSTPPGSVDLLLGNGDGTFQAAVEVLSTVASPGEVVAADFDGDGDLDFAFASASGGGPGTNGAVVVLGDGDASFAAPVGYDTTPDGNPSQLVAADFDGDGVLDLAVANFDDPGSFSILVGNGDGTFEAPLDVDTFAPPFAIAFGDPDGDGDNDLVLGSVDGYIDGYNNDVLAGPSAGATKGITVNAANDAPAENGIAGDQVTWTEGDTAVVLDSGLDATLADIDSADFAGGSLTVAITAGGHPLEDVLAIAGQGSGAGQIGISGATVTYGGVTIGTFTGGGAGASLVVAFNGNATATAAQALISAIAYDNAGGRAPTGGARTVSWTLVDGDGTANGGHDTLQFTSLVTVVPVNDAPMSSGLAGDAVTWLDGTPAALLDSGANATFGDIDSANFAGGSLTVEVTAGRDGSTDKLQIVAQGSGPGQIGLSGTTVTYGSVAIGTVSGGFPGNAITVSFNANATSAAVSALAHAIAYDSAGPARTFGARTVTWTLVDGDGTASGGTDTVTATTSLTVASRAPVMDLDSTSPGNSSSVAYTEGSPYLAIAPLASVVDADTADFQGATLTVLFTANAHADDSLQLLTQGALSVSEVDLFYDFGRLDGGGAPIGPEFVGQVTGGTGGQPLVVTFGANATLDVVQAVARAVGYMNFGTVPGALARTVSFTLSDGEGHTGAPAVATINVTPVSGGAVVNDDVLFTGDNVVLTGSLFSDNGHGNDFDTDGGALQITAINGSAVAVGATITLASGARLTVNANGSYRYDPNGVFNSLVPGDSGAANYEALDSFTYTVAGAGVATAIVHVNGVVSPGDSYDGSAGDDAITGTGGVDYFDLGQGGNDIANGGGGDDAFYFGAAFTGGDTVNGGAGTNDQIGLEGDYSGGITLGAGTISGVEVIAVLPGFDYALTTVDANVPAAGVLKVFAGALGPDDNFTFNGSAETNGGFMVFGGAGIDIITTGAGVDGIYFGPGKFDPTVDRVDGGTGPSDQLVLDGHYAITLDGTAVRNIDTITLLKGIPGDLSTYNLTLANSLTGAGQLTTVAATQIETAITVYGLAEHDGRLRILGGLANDMLTGGAGDDWFVGGLGADTLAGAGGADTFVYESASQSKVGSFDRLFGFDDRVDRIDLPFAVSGMSTTGGALSMATMGSTLQSAFASLGSAAAGVYLATAGDLTGRTFLVVDANGTTGFQASSDLLIEIVSPVSPIDNLGMFV